MDMVNFIFGIFMLIVLAILSYSCDRFRNDIYDISDENEHLKEEVKNLKASLGMLTGAINNVTYALGTQERIEYHYIHNQVHEIHIVTKERLSDIIDQRDPQGLFLTLDEDKWIACDNSTGEAWIEEFQMRGWAINWLCDKSMEGGDSDGSTEGDDGSDDSISGSSGERDNPEGHGSGSCKVITMDSVRDSDQLGSQ